MADAESDGRMGSGTRDHQDTNTMVTGNLTPAHVRPIPKYTYGEYHPKPAAENFRLPSTGNWLFAMKPGHVNPAVTQGKATRCPGGSWLDSFQVDLMPCRRQLGLEPIHPHRYIRWPDARHPTAPKAAEMITRPKTIHPAVPQQAPPPTFRCRWEEAAGAEPQTSVPIHRTRTIPRPARPCA